MNHQPDPQIELHLPDEEREFQIFLFKFRCLCQFTPCLRRKNGRFRVECGRPKEDKTIFGDVFWTEHTHTEPTPWLPSSHQAIQHWKLVVALSKP
jgi:hypothetical protein